MINRNNKKLTLLDTVGKFTISTLRPFDHPQTWETCLFTADSLSSRVVAYYDTWDAAIAGHSAIEEALTFAQGIDNG